MAAISPTIRFSEFAVSGLSPSGSRHLQTHGSFVKTLSTEADEFADFGSFNNTFIKQHTETKAVVFNVDDLKDATEAIFNMRFWVADFTDFAAGTFFFNGYMSGVWVQNEALTDASGLFIPTILPSGANVRRQDGFSEITASGLDFQSSEFIYLSVSIDTDVPAGVYGGNGGGYTYRLTYDFR